MSTNERRRDRYAQDEDYRERQIRQSREARVNQRKAREQLKKLRGWSHISSVPDNEVVLLYDPNIFWPIVAKLKNQKWECLHYQGPEPRPTHWMHLLKVPMA